MSYITTVTGKHFYPLNPNPQDIDIDDIAHALSLICRANGHFKHFYSVAQHSIACAEEAIERGYSPEVILGCLLHDASEAYLCDVTRPVKKHIPQYLRAEEKLQDVIEDMKTNKYSTRVQMPESRIIVSICNKSLRTKSLNKIIPILQEILDSYEQYEWNPDTIAEYKQKEIKQIKQNEDMIADVISKSYELHFHRKD